jgi:antibiotic biosynthesis monooxygenase (ABM) superfamily enzyme
MIVRHWHGWTTPANAEAYEALLEEEIIVGFQDRRIPGFESIRVHRREVGGEFEFLTMMVFDSLDAVREFAGENCETAVVPAQVRGLLSRYDERSQHYELRAEMRGER